MGGGRFSRLLAVGGVAGLAVAGWGGARPAVAMLPAHPTSCSFSLGPIASQGAAGTQIWEVPLVPSNPRQGCITTVSMTDTITDAAGGVPAGISRDGGTASVVLLFSSGRYQAPVVDVAWSGYCTDVPQPVYLHLSGAGLSAVYALGTSRACAFGPGPTSAVNPPRVPTPNPTVGLAVAPGGYRVAAVNGVVLRQPGQALEGGTGSVAPSVGIATDPSTGGFWVVSSDGGVFSLDGAHFYGSAVPFHPAAPVVAMVATPTGHGYWLVGADGGVFSFGDARFYGSLAGHHLAGPVVGMATSPDGRGYWLAAADGGVFAFGDARFHGSAGGLALRAPVVGIAADRATGGYWLAAADGGVFTYHAVFHGSAGALALSAPVTGVASTPDSGGYWLVAGDGGVFTFGDAPFDGSASSIVVP